MTKQNTEKEEKDKEKRDKESLRELGMTYDEAIKHATDLAEQWMRFRHALVKERRAQGISQADFAKKLDWSKKKLKNFETYDSDPRISDLRRYCFALRTKFEVKLVKD